MSLAIVSLAIVSLAKAVRLAMVSLAIVSSAPDPRRAGTSAASAPSRGLASVCRDPPPARARLGRVRVRVRAGVKG